MILIAIIFLISLPTGQIKIKQKIKIKNLRLSPVRQPFRQSLRQTRR